MSYTALEDALFTAVLAASTLDEERIRWFGQNVTRDQPDGGTTRAPLAILQLAANRALGVPTEETETDLGQAAGEEVLITSTNTTEQTFRITIFEGSGDGFPTARAMLADILNKLNLPSIYEPLHAAGVGVLSVGPVTQIGADVGAGFEPRATVDLELFYNESASERGPYIANVEISETSIPITITVE